MKYITFILYILLLLILITLFYNKMQKEHFIESVTEMCNTRKKLNLEPCLKDIPGESGIKGIMGKEGRRGIPGEPGEDGIPGMNGLHARMIGTLNFKDNITNEIIDTVQHGDEKTIKDKITNIKLLRGNPGDNARMNPIIFIDSETEKVISKQYTENWDLPEIIVPIQKGGKGIKGKNAVCTTPGKRGIKGRIGDKGTDGPKGEDGEPAPEYGPPGDVIQNPNFEMITTDNLCVNDLCIDLKMFLGMHQTLAAAAEMIESEDKAQEAIEDAANTATAESLTCPPHTNEQFTNFEDATCDNYVYNSEYCAKPIKGDRGNPGKEGDRGFDAMKGLDGIRGMGGFNGTDGEEIPNIDFIDSNKNILLGQYKGFNEKAKTEKIYLTYENKGDPGYIPNIIFKYNNNVVKNKNDQNVSHINTRDTTNDSNKNKDNTLKEIIVHLDNSKGERGKEGIDGICEIGDEGDEGTQGPRGDQGPKGPRGYDGIEGEKGDPGPKDKNPNYIKVTADKYCFSDYKNEVFSDICLDKNVLSKLIIAMKAKKEMEDAIDKSMDFIDNVTNILK